MALSAHHVTLAPSSFPRAGTRVFPVGPLDRPDGPLYRGGALRRLIDKEEGMRRLAPLLALALAGWSAATTHAGDVALSIDGQKFSAATVTMKRGDRLVVANQSRENHFIYGHSGGYAFDYRATESNAATHKPGERHGIPMHVPGKYRLSCALHPGMTATVTVEE
jgi:plastocyanin